LQEFRKIYRSAGFYIFGRISGASAPETGLSAPIPRSAFGGPAGFHIVIQGFHRLLVRVFLQGK
jgi:hypothetical protein